MVKRASVPEDVPVIASPPPVLPDDLIKVDGVMEIFKVSRTEIYYLMQKGMPHYKLGGKRNLRFSRGKLAVWLQEQMVS